MNRISLHIASALVALLLLLPGRSRAEIPDSSSADLNYSYYLSFDTTESLEFLFTLFPPFLIQNGIELKEFVRSDEFKQLREQFGDAKAIDAIYIHAMRLTKNNTGFALLLSTLASFDHSVLRFDVPLFLLAFPLTDESAEEFQARIGNLPAHFFPDSPKGKTGDRDKLQHFFGSAFLTFAFGTRGPAERIGTAIEHGEEAIVIGGANDSRDFRANFLGQEFGIALAESPFQFPSSFLLHSIAQPEPLPDTNNTIIENALDSCR